MMKKYVIFSWYTEEWGFIVLLFYILELYNTGTDRHVEKSIYKEFGFTLSHVCKALILKKGGFIKKTFSNLKHTFVTRSAYHQHSFEKKG